MQRISLVNVAHNLIREILRPGDIAVDATVGNGHDTLFLVEQVGPSGKVFGFDIQLDAIASTRAKVDSYRTGEIVRGDAPVQAINLTLIHANHADMRDKIPAHYHGGIGAIMFNLGYLPGGNKGIITLTNSTLSALNSASRLVSSNGIITVLAYPGHQGGDLETEEIKNWCEQLDKVQYKTRIIYSSENNESSPKLFVLYKMS
jgi:hypothetical protein